MKKEVKLYNLIFPMFMLYVFPNIFWLILIPLNFAVDSLVVILAAMSKKMDWKDLWKRTILKVVIIGFLCDFAGAALTVVLSDSVFSNLNAYLWPDVTWMALPGVIVAGVLLYVASRWFTFSGIGLEKKEMHFFSLVIAIATAPYTMMLPLYIR